MESIDTVTITKENTLLLTLQSGGKSEYEYIYREAAGISWNKIHKGFESTTLKEDLSCSQWFSHILKITKECNIEITLSPNVKWNNVPENEIENIKNEHSI